MDIHDFWNAVLQQDAIQNDEYQRIVQFIQDRKSSRSSVYG